MAEKAIMILLIVTLALTIFWLVWLFVSDYRDRQESRQREREFLEAMRELELAAGIGSEPEKDPGLAVVKEVQAPEPKTKPAKLEAERAKRPKTFYTVTLPEKDQQDEDRNKGRGRE